MYNDKKILGIIPARGGSKGVPGKNIRDLAGKPLIAWTIEAAKKTRYIDACIVSTDNEKIREVSEKWGGYCPFLRPTEIAQDDSSSVDVVLHGMEEMPGYDYVVLLQPTCPLRLPQDIDGCIEKCISHGVESCVSVTESEHSPYWMYSMDENGILCPILNLDYDSWYQRQKLPKTYQLNGAVYVARVDFVRQHHRLLDKGTIGYVMPKENSYDIDTSIDFEIAELVMSR